MSSRTRMINLGFQIACSSACLRAGSRANSKHMVARTPFADASSLHPHEVAEV